MFRALHMPILLPIRKQVQSLLLCHLIPDANYSDLLTFFDASPPPVVLY